MDQDVSLMETDSIFVSSHQLLHSSQAHALTPTICQNQLLNPTTGQSGNQIINQLNSNHSQLKGYQISQLQVHQCELYPNKTQIYQIHRHLLRLLQLQLQKLHVDQQELVNLQIDGVMISFKTPSHTLQLIPVFIETLTEGEEESILQQS